jgi:NAD-dependent deacetylase
MDLFTKKYIRSDFLNKVIFFTGAGISKDAGIPTFQEQDDIRAKLKRSFANKYPEEYRATIQMMKDACDKAEPTVAHIAIA